MIAGQRAKGRLERVGEGLAFAGMLAPLLLIGIAKFTQPEIEALKPVIGGTPWLSWLYALFGEAGASHLLGIVELATAALLLLGLQWRLAGLIGGLLACFTFAVTCSLMLALPIWDPNLGMPILGPAGQFLVKDVALLGIAAVIAGRCLHPTPSGA